MEVLVKILDHYKGPMPPLKQAREGDVGFDIYAAKSVTIRPGEREIIPTGIAIAIPEGYEAQMRTNSGNASKLGLSILNSPGTIDPGYRGELFVIAQNNNPVLSPEVMDALFELLVGNIDPTDLEEAYDLHYSRNVITIKEGAKIGQLVFNKVEYPTFTLTRFLPPSERDEDGLGSTGLATEAAK